MTEKEKKEIIEKEEADEVATTEKLMENETVIKDDMQKQQEQDHTTKMDSSEIEDSKAAKITSDMDAQISKIADESACMSLDGKDKATIVMKEEQETIIATKEIEEAEIATKEKEFWYFSLLHPRDIYVSLWPLHVTASAHITCAHQGSYERRTNTSSNDIICNNYL